MAPPLAQFMAQQKLQRVSAGLKGGEEGIASNVSSTAVAVAVAVGRIGNKQKYVI